jgi:hypothetical protein
MLGVGKVVVRTWGLVAHLACRVWNLHSQGRSLGVGDDFCGVVEGRRSRDTRAAGEGTGEGRLFYTGEDPKSHARFRQSYQVSHRCADLFPRYRNRSLILRGLSYVTHQQTVTRSVLRGYLSSIDEAPKMVLASTQPFPISALPADLQQKFTQQKFTGIGCCKEGTAIIENGRKTTKPSPCLSDNIDNVANLRHVRCSCLWNVGHAQVLTTKS